MALRYIIANRTAPVIAEAYRDDGLSRTGSDIFIRAVEAIGNATASKTR